jgi:FAD/FMN-containing dehydrogenase
MNTTSARAVDELRSRFRGTIVLPHDPEYDAVRSIWNAMIDRRPAIMARCRSVSDVVNALQFGIEHGYQMSVRGGGHNVAGSCLVDDGLIVDLSLMKGIRIDPGARTARLEPGVLWDEFDQEAQAFGLATVGGTVADTGVAGLTLGGGFGWLTNKHGLTIDNLLSVDIVTADGQRRYASADENPDLFWAIRGAGANFGVVTSFEFRLHPVGPDILGGMVLYPLDQLRDVLQFYRELVDTAPLELTAYAAVLTGPDGIQVVAIAVCYSGGLAAGMAAVEPLRRFGKPIVDLLRPTTYLDQQAILTQAAPPGRQNYWKAGMSRALTDGAIDVIGEYAPQVPSPFTVILIAGNDGVAGQVASHAMAYAHRRAIYNVVALSAWENREDSDCNIEWTRAFHRDLQTHLSGGVYVNDLQEVHDEGEARVREAYGDNYDRLVALKTMYDPANIFRSNQNIKPNPRQKQVGAGA